MSNTERDTHFAGFAKLLWDELVEANGYGYIDVNKDDDGIDPTNYRLLIAKRAYDLVYFLTQNAYQGAYENGRYRGNYPLPEQIRKSIEMLPDLTQWPEEEKPV